MMSPALVAFFFAAGAAGWIYSKMAHRTGNANPSQTVIFTAIAGLMIFFFFWMVVSTIDRSLG